MQESIRREQPIERQRRILGNQVGVDNLFVFPKVENAIARSQQILLESDKAVYFDIDDALVKYSESYLRNKLESILRERGASIPHATIGQIVEAGGRYFQYEPYQQAAREAGFSNFRELFDLVSTDKALHARMLFDPRAAVFQEELAKLGFVNCGYPTARPGSLAEVTAAGMKEFGFSVAPIIDVSADSRDPSMAKVNFFRTHVVPFIREGQQVLFFDDHVPTALAINEQFKGQIIPLVPIVPRNKAEIERLKKARIIHGSYSDILGQIRPMIK